jgi:hypothetical protein
VSNVGNGMGRSSVRFMFDEEQVGGCRSTLGAPTSSFLEGNCSSTRRRSWVAVPLPVRRSGVRRAAVLDQVLEDERLFVRLDKMFDEY